MLVFLQNVQDAQVGLVVQDITGTETWQSLAGRLIHPRAVSLARSSELADD